MQAVFYGVGAAVIGIITISATKLTQKTIGRDPLLRAISLGSAAATIVTETENILLFLSAGALVWFVRAGRGSPPRRPGLGHDAAGLRGCAARRRCSAPHAARPDRRLLHEGRRLRVRQRPRDRAISLCAIAGACVVLGRRTLFETGWSLEVPKLVILLATMGLLLRFKKLPEPLVIVGAAIGGLAIWPWLPR